MSNTLHGKIMLLLAIGGCLGAAPPLPPPPAPPAPPLPPAASAPIAGSPATTTAPAIRKHFENGEPIGDFFTALAVRFEAIIIQPKPVDAYILRSFDLPEKLDEALTLTRQTLEPQGYAIVQSVAEGRLVLRIVTTEEAKKAQLANSPVSVGTQGEAVDVSDPTRLVTHLLPVTHVDLVETLRRTAKQDPEVSVEVAGGNAIGVNLILMGPALSVQKAIEAVAKLDKPVGGPVIVRTLRLQNIGADAAARTLNAGFAGDAAPLRAVADVRTNSIVITGPEDQVMEALIGLVTQDARQGRVLTRPPAAPATLPATRPGARGPAPALDGNGPAGDNAAIPLALAGGNRSRLL